MVGLHAHLLFAHASGFSWDEALLVLAPIALVAAVLFLANQRAKKLGSPTDGSADERADASADAPQEPSRPTGDVPDR